MPDEHAAMAPPALQLSSDLSNPFRKRLKMNPAAPAPRSAASILARSFGSVPDAKLMKPLNYTGNAGQILVRMMQRKNQWIIQSQAWDVSTERSAYRNVIDSLVSRIFATIIIYSFVYLWFIKLDMQGLRQLQTVCSSKNTRWAPPPWYHNRHSHTSS